MSDPISINCPADEWTEVATNVTTGIINIMDPEAAYYVTQVDTGGSDPSDTPNPGEAAFIGNPIFPFSAKAAGKAQFGGQAFIESTLPIDVFIYCAQADGRVVVIT